MVYQATRQYFLGVGGLIDFADENNANSAM
jgi:hypothetical protein